MAIQPDQCRVRHTSVRTAMAAAMVSVLGALTLAPAATAAQRDGRGSYQQWEQMPQQQRERILQEQQRFKRLPPSEQERLRREYEQRRKQ